MKPTSIALAALALLLAACASPPATRYYSLAPALLPSPASPASPASSLQIELPPLALPERLVRPQLVVRSPANPFEVLEQHRWAAPFPSELHDALASGIAQQLGAIDVSTGGRLAGQPVYRIAVQLRQWDAALDQQVQASFSWTLRRSDGTRSLACHWNHTEPAAPGIAALAQSAQRLAQHAAQRMAASVAALDANAAAPCPG